MRGLIAGLSVVIATSGLAGCGSESTPGQPSAAPPGSETPPSQGTPKRPERKAFDPPKVFAIATTVGIPQENFGRSEDLRAALSDGVLYFLNSKTLSAMDPVTNEDLWTVKHELESFLKGKTHAPAVHQESNRVYGAYSVKVPGKGTTPTHPAIEVQSVDLKTGKQDWLATVDVETKDPGSVQDGDVTVVGATADSVVVSWYSQDFMLGKTYVLDTRTHQVRWQKDLFLAGEVDGDVVIGNEGRPFVDEPRKLTAFALADGGTKWTSDLGKAGAGIMPIAPKLVMVDKSVPSDSSQRFEILDVQTGKALYTLPVRNVLGQHYRMTCYYDEKSFIACEGNGSGDTRVLGFDAADIGQQPTWEITKTASRTPPHVTAAYHGIVYGTGADGKPVALDAKTGQDAPDLPGVAPMLVDKYVGVDSKGGTHKPTE